MFVSASSAHRILGQRCASNLFLESGCVFNCTRSLLSPPALPPTPGLAVGFVKCYINSCQCFIQCLLNLAFYS